MRKVFAAAVVAASVGAAPLAYAAGAPKPVTTTGKIKAVDMIRHSITLDNGKTYQVSRGVNIRYIKSGEKVIVTCTGTGAAIEASAIASVD